MIKVLALGALSLTTLNGQTWSGSAVSTTTTGSATVGSTLTVNGEFRLQNSSYGDLGRALVRAGNNLYINYAGDMVGINMNPGSGSVDISSTSNSVALKISGGTVQNFLKLTAPDVDKVGVMINQENRPNMTFLSSGTTDYPVGTGYNPAIEMNKDKSVTIYNNVIGTNRGTTWDVNNTGKLLTLEQGGQVTVGETRPTVEVSGSQVASNNYRFAVTGGNVIIGSGFKALPSSYKLFVEGGILTEKLKCAIKTTSDWSDFVFANDYKLKSLDSVETYIKSNKHLPDVPSAEEVVKQGIDVAKMDAKLLQKIEELTLYVIEINKKVSEQESTYKNKVALLEKKIEALESENNELKK